MPVHLHSYTRASPFLDAAVQIFVQTWPSYDLAATRSSFMRYAALRDFHGIVAVSDSVVVGFGFGVRSAPGIRWHDQMTAH